MLRPSPAPLSRPGNCEKPIFTYDWLAVWVLPLSGKCGGFLSLQDTKLDLESLTWDESGSEDLRPVQDRVGLERRADPLQPGHDQDEGDA